MITYLGDEAAYYQWLQAQASLAALQVQGEDALKGAIAAMWGSMQAKGIARAEDPWAMPPLLEVKDGVGIIQASGPLVSGSAGFMRLFGILGYDDIKMALNDAVMSKDVKSILFSMSSPGGQVDGVEDMSSYMVKAGAVKPISVHVGSIMASAAYWFGASAQHISANKTAKLGSIGVFMIHTDRSKQDEQNGVKRTIIRAGKYKALVNDVEPLSEEAKEKLKTEAETVYDVFVSSIAPLRGKTPEEFDKKMGQGREFLGQAAVDVGLADAVMTFEEAFAHAKSLDTPKSIPNNPRNLKGESMKAFLASAAISSIMASGSIAGLDFKAAATTVDNTVPDDEGQAMLKAQAEGILTSFQAQSGALVATATAELKAAVATKDTEITSLKAQVESAKATSDALAQAAATSKPMIEKATQIVAGSASTMNVALGGKADLLKDKPLAEVLSEHERLSKDFQVKFPGGQASANTKTSDESKADTTQVPEWAAIARDRAAARAKA